MWLAARQTRTNQSVSFWERWVCCHNSSKYLLIKTLLLKQEKKL